MSAVNCESSLFCVPSHFVGPKVMAEPPQATTQDAVYMHALALSIEAQLMHFPDSVAVAAGVRLFSGGALGEAVENHLERIRANLIAQLVQLKVPFDATCEADDN